MTSLPKITDNMISNLSDFLYAPDEEFLTPSEFIDSVDSQVLHSFAPCDTANDNPEKWLESCTEESKLLCVPYVDILSGRQFPLPLQLIRFIYGSTEARQLNNLITNEYTGLCIFNVTCHNTE